MARRWWLPAAVVAGGAAAFLFLLVRSREAVEPPPARVSAEPRAAAPAPPPIKPVVPVLPEEWANLPAAERVSRCLMMAGTGDWHLVIYEGIAADPEARALLLERLRSGETLLERSSALMMLALGDGPEADDLVREAARGGYGEELSVLAITAASRRAAPERFMGFLGEFIDPQYSPGVVCEAYRRLFPLNSKEAVERLLAGFAPARSPEESDLLWETLMGIRIGHSGPVPAIFDQQYEDGRLWAAVHLRRHDADQSMVRQLLALVRSEEGRRRPVQSFAVAAAVRGEEGDRAMWEVYGSASREERVEMVRMIGGYWAPERLPGLLAAAPDLEDAPVRKVLAETAGGWLVPENLPELKAWRNLETEPEIRDLLDEAITRLEPR